MLKIKTTNKLIKQETRRYDCYTWKSKVNSLIYVDFEGVFVEIWFVIEQYDLIAKIKEFKKCEKVTCK